MVKCYKWRKLHNMKKKINVFKLVQSLPNDVHIVYPVNGYLSIKKKKKKKKLNGKNLKK